MHIFPKYHFYINRSDRGFKNKECLDTLKSFGISQPIRLDAIKHEIGYVGCAQSHIKCIELAKERDYPFVCIFEDDIILDDTLKDKVTNIITKITINENQLFINEKTKVTIDELITSNTNWLVNYMSK